MNDQTNPARKPDEATGQAAPTKNQENAGGQMQGIGAQAKDENRVLLSDYEKSAGYDTGSDGTKGKGIGVTASAGRFVQIPTIGRIVHYRLAAEDAEGINRRREHSDNHRSIHKQVANGTMIHVGATVTDGQVLPMIVTGVAEDSGAINGQVFLTGNDMLWISYAEEGSEPGNYSWPSRS